MNIEDFFSNFETVIAAATSPKTRIETIAATLSELFRVNPDEIAIFSFDKARDVLVFVWPSSLISVGSIPLNAHRCLAAKTAVDNKQVLDNSFASTPHLYMFEHFLSDKGKRIPIQKIMSSPITAGETLKGVIQIARKGQTREASGDDFTNPDIALLTKASAIIGRYF
jgi:hypothetical protein